MGTTKIIAQIFISDSSNGSTNVTCVGSGKFAGYNEETGMIITDLTTTTFNLQTNNFILARTQSETFTSGYARIIMIALE